MGVDVPGALSEFGVRPSSTFARPRQPIQADALALLTDAVATPYHALVGVAALQAGETPRGSRTGRDRFERSAAGSCTWREGDRAGAQPAQLGPGPEARCRASDSIGYNSRAKHLRACNGGGLDVVLVATDAPGAVELAVAAYRPGGRVVLVGASHEPVSVSSVQLIWSEIQLRGSRGFTTADIREVQELHLDGSIQVDHLISDVRPLSEVGRASGTSAPGTRLAS